MYDPQELVRSILGATKQKIASIPPLAQQVQEFQQMSPQAMQDQALKMVMAGSISSPQSLIGNQPKIAGTLLDVSNLKNLQSQDYMDAIGNMKSLANELLPKQVKSKAMQTLENKDIEEWMKQMAAAIIKKTKIYPSMGQ